MKWLLRCLYRNQVRLAAALTLYYYRKMKSVESKFRASKAWLLAIAPRSCEVKTLFGLARVSTVKQAVLDNEQLLKHVDHRKLLEMSDIRVNLVLKHMGKKFDAVVKNWYDEKRVLLLTKYKGGC